MSHHPERTARNVRPVNQPPSNYNVEQRDLQGEEPITNEHVTNNKTVRDMLGSRGIVPENLPPAADIRKLERHVKSQDKRIASDETAMLPGVRERF